MLGGGGGNQAAAGSELLSSKFGFFFFSIFLRNFLKIYVKVMYDIRIRRYK